MYYHRPDSYACPHACYDLILSFYHFYCVVFLANNHASRCYSHLLNLFYIPCIISLSTRFSRAHLCTTLPLHAFTISHIQVSLALMSLLLRSLGEDTFELVVSLTCQDSAPWLAFLLSQSYQQMFSLCSATSLHHYRASSFLMPHDHSLVYMHFFSIVAQVILFNEIILLLSLVPKPNISIMIPSTTHAPVASISLIVSAPQAFANVGD